MRRRERQVERGRGRVDVGLDAGLVHVADGLRRPRAQRRTSRWKISRLCFLAATKLGSDSVATSGG